MENQLLIIFFIIIFLKNSLFWTALWQIKEYRLDRFLNFIATPDGQKSLFNKSFAWELLGLVVLIITEADSGLSQKISIFFLTVEALYWLWLMARQQLVKPVWTKKTLLITFLSLLLASLIIVAKITFVPQKFYQAMIAINLLSVIWVSLIIILIYPLSYILKQKTIKAAKIKIKNLPWLKIIGITGSYGKTSVKEFTFSIINPFFKTAKTERNNNSEMGVAKTVLIKDLKNAEIFIAEMGAYKVGEIQKICDITPPNIAILTGIDEQHNALFGGLENTKRAKSEILYFTAPNSIAILNYDNENVRELTWPENLSGITYGLAYGGADVKGELLSLQNGWQTFKVLYEGQSQTFKTKLIGEHNVLNILAALTVGLVLGKTLEVMREAVAALTPVPETMDLLIQGRLSLIDDAYNANPTGVKAALKTLINFNETKVVILDDILELGREAKNIHLEIAKFLAENYFDKIILTGKNYDSLIKKEMLKLGQPTENILTEAEDQKDINNYLYGLKNKKAAVLFEGRRSKKYLKKFIG